jgi:orotidine-5'-phosphate decarboxylase
VIAPFAERLAEAADRTAPVAVGLDPHLDHLPPSFRAGLPATPGPAFRAAAAAAAEAFCAEVLHAVHGVVPVVKPQVAFFEQLGSPGVAALERTCALARELGLLVLLDAKRGDISTTGEAYARACLDPDGPIGADAVTLNAWMGLDTLDPYLPWVERYGRGLFVLVRTTNPGSALLQRHGEPGAALALAAGLQALNARLAGGGWGPVGAVVGAQAAAEAPALRAALPGGWFLVPGVGAQGGAIAEALAGAGPDGRGALPVASRSVIFARGEDGADIRAGVRARAMALAEEVRGELRRRRRG